MMTPSEEGAYFRLLCYAWLDPDCSIPNDDGVLAILSRLGEGWLKGGSSGIIKARFQPHPTIPDRLVNERLIEEREKQESWREKSRQGGIKSALSRGCKSVNGSTTLQPSRLNQRATSHSLFAVCSLHSTTQVGASEIYDAYPRKVGRPKAISAIANQMRSKCPGCLLKLTQDYARARAGSLDEIPSVPHPTTWFNQQRFNDDPATWKPREQLELGVPVFKQISILDEAIAKHPANSESTFHRPDCTPEQRAELREKRQKLAELKGSQ